MQFHSHESRGVRPRGEAADPFYTRLLRGKEMHDALAKAVRGTYGTPEWQGFAADRDRMPGWLFRAFYGWHPVASVARDE